MRKKLSLDVDALSVDSFETTAAGAHGRGTVHAREIVGDPQPTPPVDLDNCTCAASCPCPTAAYYCATVRATAISCDYTQNLSCWYDTDTACLPAD
jgi:hypothetical protein